MFNKHIQEVRIVRSSRDRDKTGIEKCFSLFYRPLYRQNVYMQLYKPIFVIYYSIGNGPKQFVGFGSVHFSSYFGRDADRTYVR